MGADRYRSALAPVRVSGFPGCPGLSMPESQGIIEKGGEHGALHGPRTRGR
jgi:hypothetical protein